MNTDTNLCHLEAALRELEPKVKAQCDMNTQQTMTFAITSLVSLRTSLCQPAAHPLPSSERAVSEEERKGWLWQAREDAAKVCDSRAKSLHEGGQHSAANEAGKCAIAIRQNGLPSVVSQEFWDGVHRQRALEADAQKWRDRLVPSPGDKGSER